MNKTQIVLDNGGKPFDPEFIKNLKTMASGYGVAIDDQSMQESNIGRERFLKKSKALADKIGPISSDSANDIRDQRDRG